MAEGTKGIFGCDLSVVCDRQGTTVPTFFSKFIHQIEVEGLDFQGIHNVSGNTELIHKLKDIIEKGLELPRLIDIDVVTGCLQLYLEQLPEPLIPSVQFQSLATLASTPSPHMLWNILKNLPRAHYDTLKLLIQHLKKVAGKSYINKMNATNLAEVFGPIITKLGKRPQNSTPNDIQNKIVELLIQECEGIFFDHEPVFNEELTVVCSYQKCDVPIFLAQFIKYIEKEGIAYEGIYQKNSSPKLMDKMRYVVEKASGREIVIDRKWMDVYLIANCLKMYFKELPRPIIPFLQFVSLVKAAEKSDHEKVPIFGEVMTKLPTFNLKTLKLLFHHLKKVSDNSEINKLSVKNAGNIFGSLLIQAEMIPQISAKHLKLQNSIVEIMIINYDAIFFQNRVLGVDLSLLCKRQNTTIPQFLIKFILFIQEHDPRELQDLYEKPDEYMTIDYLKRTLEDGEEVDFSEVDVHGVAQFIKTFFKEMPTPVIPCEQFKKLARIIKEVPDALKAIHMAKIIGELPPGHSDTLQVVTWHLNNIIMNVDDITVEKIGSIFGSVLMRMGEFQEKVDENNSSKILQLLIKEYDKIFPHYEPVFGYELTELCKFQGTYVPIFMVQFMEHIEEFGLHYKEVYQKSSEPKFVAKLRYLVEKGCGDRVDLYQEWLDIPVITDCLIKYLKELPQPLIKHELLQPLVDATTKQYGETLELYAEILKKLPLANYVTLRTLLYHLKKVMQQCERNKFTLQRAGDIFGSILMQAEEDPKLKKYDNLQSEIVEIMIEGCESIFLHNVFGCKLSTLCDHQGTTVPKFLVNFMLYIEMEGIKCKGIYQKPGNPTRTKDLRHMIEEVFGGDLKTFGDWIDVHIVADNLKSYFKELPKPLIPWKQFRSLANVVMKAPKTEQAGIFAIIVKELPLTHYNTLKIIVEHLGKMVTNSLTNGFTAPTAGVIFGPLFMKAATYTPQATAECINLQSQIVELMITECENIFSQHDPVFNCDLSALCQRQGTNVPNFFVQFIQYIEKVGLDKGGIYQTIGDPILCDELCYIVERGGDINLNLEWLDVTVIADCSKKFLRELPEPLIPFARQEKFIEAAKTPAHGDKIMNITKEVNMLPSAHYNTLKLLIEHLRKIAENNQFNQMSATSLAGVFGPIVARARSPLQTASFVTFQYFIIELMVNEYESIFGIKSDVAVPVFGCQLSILCKYQKSNIPKFLSMFILHIESVGINQVGIYTYTDSKISEFAGKLRSLIDQGEPIDLIKKKWANVHVLAHCIKQYLAELPDPVIPFRMYRPFIEATTGAFARNEQVDNIASEVQALPEAHYHTLNVIIKHLKKVVERKLFNKVSVTNLSTIFGPLLMRSKIAILDQEQETINEMVKIMILEYDNIFGIGNHRDTGRISWFTLLCLRQKRGSAGVMKMQEHMVFGCDLTALCERQGTEVPMFFIEFMEYVENAGLEIEGIYKPSGINAAVAKLRNMVEKGDTIALNEVNPSVVAGCVKLYLRQLPDPLLPFKYYHTFIMAAGAPTHLQIIQALKNAVKMLPPANYHTLVFLTQHLKKVVRMSKMNKMSCEELGIVFGPIVLREETISVEGVIKMGHRYQIMELMISEHDTIFPTCSTDDNDDSRNIKGKGKKGSVKQQPSAPEIRQDTIFGCDLSILKERQGTYIPKFLVEFMDYIDKKGLKEPGLYRGTGHHSSLINKLRHKVDQEEDNILNDPELDNVMIVAGCVKLFLRKLPDPLIPFGMYQSFIDAARTSTYNEKIKTISLQVQSLPEANYHTLKALMQHLKRVTTRSRHNKLSTTNAGIIFGPILIRPKKGSIEVKDKVILKDIVKIMIREYDIIFGDGKPKVRRTAWKKLFITSSKTCLRIS